MSCILKNNQSDELLFVNSDDLDVILSIAVELCVSYT